MKRILFSLLTASTVAFTAGPSLAAGVGDYTAGLAASGIGGTRHNLGSYGPVIHTGEQATIYLAGRGTTEICVFCHTPHHTNTANGLKPMWNRGTSAPTSFTAYGATIGGSTVANTDIGSTTLACLSCHDGVTTFDNIVNAPGKDGVTAGGSDRGWWFLMPGDVGLITSPLDHFSNTGCTTCHGAASSGMGQITRLNLGLDLSNDHPVSVTYSIDRAGLRPVNTVISSIDLTSELASSATAALGGNLAQNRWAVKGFISETATISDLLRDGRVECSSCHDPHFKNGSWDEVESASYANWCGNSEYCTDGQFLRRVGGNTGSGVCRTCHEK